MRRFHDGEDSLATSAPAQPRQSRRRLWQLWLRLLPAVLWLALPRGVAGEPDLPVIRMGYAEFPPYSFTGPAGVPDGLSIDLMDEAAGRAGYDVRFVPTGTPARMLDALVRGAIDASSLLAVTPARTTIAAATSSAGHLDFALIARSGEDRFDSPLGLAGLRLGVIAGSRAADIAGRIEGAETVRQDSFGAMMMLLLGGGIDAVIAPPQAFRRVAERAGIAERFTVLGAPLETREMAFLVAPDRPGLVADLNHAIAAMRRSGDLEALSAKWLGRPYSIWRDPAIGWSTAAGILLMLVASGLASFLIIRQARRRSADAARLNWQTLLSALDGIDTVMVVFDTEMRAIYWNRAMVERFPSALPLLDRRATVAELVASAYRSGEIVHSIAEDEIDEFARRVTESLTDGTDNERIVHISGGGILRARDYFIPGGYFVSTWTDVTQIMRSQENLRAAYADLARTNAKLAEANAQLERFTNVAAHDLRAPLRAVMTLPGWIREELKEAGIAPPGEVAGLLDDIDDQARSMDRMLKDLLDYARIGAGARERVRFAPGERIAGIARMAGLPDDFILEIAPDLPELELNTVEFETVIRNLLSNAVKHHDRESGRIIVSGWRDGGSVVLEVEDDGPGIAPEHHERVFEIFSILNTEERSAGMGLAFVRQLVRNWGGHVAIRAPEHGRGTVFRLQIPEQPPDTRRAA